MLCPPLPYKIGNSWEAIPLFLLNIPTDSYSVNVALCVFPYPTPPRSHKNHNSRVFILSCTALYNLVQLFSIVLHCSALLLIVLHCSHLFSIALDCSCFDCIDTMKNICIPNLDCTNNLQSFFRAII